MGGILAGTSARHKAVQPAVSLGSRLSARQQSGSGISFVPWNWTTYI